MAVSPLNKTSLDPEALGKYWQVTSGPFLGKALEEVAAPHHTPLEEDFRGGIIAG